jgi:hypothetical protein
MPKIHKHTKIKIIDACTFMREKDYGLRFFDFEAQRLLFVPEAESGYEFPGMYRIVHAVPNADGKTIAVWFIQSIPVPRGCHLLNTTIVNNLTRHIVMPTIQESCGTEFEETEEFKGKVEALIHGVLNSTFTSKEESKWWWDFHRFEITQVFTPVGYYITIILKDFK